MGGRVYSTYAADEVADLVGHDVEVLAGQRTQQVVDAGAAVDDVLQQAVRAEQAPQDRLHATALDATRHQRHVVTCSADRTGKGSP